MQNCKPPRLIDRIHTLFTNQSSAIFFLSAISLALAPQSGQSFAHILPLSMLSLSIRAITTRDSVHIIAAPLSKPTELRIRNHLGKSRDEFSIVYLVEAAAGKLLQTISSRINKFPPLTLAIHMPMS